MKLIAKVFLLLLMAAGATTGAAQGSAPGGSAPPKEAAAAATAGGWTIYTLGAKDAFRIAFPQKPEAESQNLNENGYKMKATYYSSASSSIFAIVADLYDLPLTAEKLPAETQKFFFEKVRQGLIDGMQAEFRKSGINPEIKFGPRKEVSASGLSGFEQDVAIGPFSGRTRMLVKGDHFYIFFTVLLDNTKPAQLAEFLDSFEYVGGK